MFCKERKVWFQGYGSQHVQLKQVFTRLCFCFVYIYPYLATYVSTQFSDSHLNSKAVFPMHMIIIHMWFIRLKSYYEEARGGMISRTELMQDFQHCCRKIGCDSEYTLMQLLRCVKCVGNTCICVLYVYMFNTKFSVDQSYC